MNASDEDVLRFIAASFPSIWALELLLKIKSESRRWTREELVTDLRASDDVVNKAIDALVVGGLASADTGGASFMPVNGEVEDYVERAEQLYRTRANRVRRAIISANAGGATAFAEAFKIRKGRDD